MNRTAKKISAAKKMRDLRRANSELQKLVRFGKMALWGMEFEISELRADKERLDWLARNRSVSLKERPWAVTPESLRAAIDVARKEAQP